MGNIIINSVMGSITNFTEQLLDYSVPHYAEDTIHKLISNQFSSAEYSILKATAYFSVENLEIEGEIVLIFGVGSLQILLKAIDTYQESLES